MKLLNKLEEGLIMAGLVVIGGVLTIQIFMRYVLNQPLVWSEELARYIFVWVTFIGASYGIRKKIHISMEIFYNHLPQRIRMFVTIITNLIIVFVLLYHLPWGIAVIKDQSGILSSAMQIPMSFVYSAMPFMCLIAALRLIGETVTVIRTRGANL
jgi:TRAP-type C4-dicarboxylate transport system permease small subunit